MDQDVSGHRRLKSTGLPAAEAGPRPRSRPGPGACNDNPNDDATLTEGVDRPAAAYRNPRALIVDDNECNRLLLAHIVALAGGTSEQAADGVEALERLADGAFDVVFMDIAMPRMDGVAATCEIRRRKNPVVVLAVTAHYDARDADRLAAIGFDGLIPKPIDLILVLSWLFKQAGAGASVA